MFDEIVLKIIRTIKDTNQKETDLTSIRKFYNITINKKPVATFHSKPTNLIRENQNHKATRLNGLATFRIIAYLSKSPT